MELVLLPLIAVLIFFMFRNGRKRRQEQEALQEKLVPGAEVMTSFGLFGTLVSIDEESNIAVLESGPGSTVRVHRQTLTRVVEDEPAVEAEADATVVGADDSAAAAPAIETAEPDSPATSEPPKHRRGRAKPEAE